MSTPAPAAYFLVTTCAEDCETTVTEFDHYDAAFEIYKAREIAGYSVVIHEGDFFGAVANELRAHANYKNLCTVDE